jgi:hypothetical protein
MFFPLTCWVGIGLALVIGSVLNYIIIPKGNPLLMFGGIALVPVAIVLDAIASAHPQRAEFGLLSPSRPARSGRRGPRGD